MKSHLAFLSFLTLSISACGGSAFTGNASKRIGATQNGGSKTEIPQASTDNENNLPKVDGSQVKLGQTDDDKAIEACLAKFGNHPFSETSSYRKIAASVQVLGFGKGIVDDQITQQPELILISAAVNVLGESVYQLKNPNGWYCLKVDVNVKADTTIELACGARLADNKVNVAVGGASQPTGRVGVHVFSDVRVDRIGNCGG